MLAGIGLKQMGLQSSFKCSGWRNVSNLTRQEVSDRQGSTGKRAMSNSNCLGFKVFRAVLNAVVGGMYLI